MEESFETENQKINKIIKNIDKDLDSLAREKLLKAYGKGSTYTTSGNNPTTVCVLNISGFDHIYIAQSPGNESPWAGKKLVSKATNERPSHYVSLSPETDGFSGHHALREEPVYMLIDFTVLPCDVYGPYTISMGDGKMIPAENGVSEWPPDAEQMKLVQAMPIRDMFGRLLYEGCVIKYREALFSLSFYHDKSLIAKVLNSDRVLIMKTEGLSEDSIRFLDLSKCEIVSNIYNEKLKEEEK